MQTKNVKGHPKWRKPLPALGGAHESARFSAMKIGQILPVSRLGMHKAQVHRAMHPLFDYKLVQLPNGKVGLKCVGQEPQPEREDTEAGG